jgi:hypothetical protein
MSSPATFTPGSDQTRRAGHHGEAHASRAHAMTSTFRASHGGNPVKRTERDLAAPSATPRRASAVRFTGGGSGPFGPTTPVNSYQPVRAR